jgi:hypothetical protein
LAICRDRATRRWPQADLVIHVGDYYYRKTPCPAERTGCVGSAYGDSWTTWLADFFTPAAPLLSAAPWVTVRGNHELCNRGGQERRRLLDPHIASSECTAFSDPYVPHLGGLNLLVLDSADADDFSAPAEKVAAYATQLAGLLKVASSHAWLLTHRPVWALAQGKLAGQSINATLQTAIRRQIPPALASANAFRTFFPSISVPMSGALPSGSSVSPLSPTISSCRAASTISRAMNSDPSGRRS